MFVFASSIAVADVVEISKEEHFLVNWLVEKNGQKMLSSLPLVSNDFLKADFRGPKTSSTCCCFTGNLLHCDTTTLAFFRHGLSLLDPFSSSFLAVVSGF